MARISTLEIESERLRTLLDKLRSLAISYQLESGDLVIADEEESRVRGLLGLPPIEPAETPSAPNPQPSEDKLSNKQQSKVNDPASLSSSSQGMRTPDGTTVDREIPSSPGNQREADLVVDVTTSQPIRPSLKSGPEEVSEHSLATSTSPSTGTFSDDSRLSQTEIKKLLAFAGVLLAVILLVVIANRGTSSIENASSVSQASPSSQTATTTPTPESTTTVLRTEDLVDANSFDHQCGRFSITTESADAVIWARPNGMWIISQRVPYPVPDSQGGSGTLAQDLDFVVRDLNNDGDPEILLDWSLKYGYRNVGAIIGAERDTCLWSKQLMVDSGGGYELYDALAYEDSEGFTGSGFARGDGRERVRFVWVPEASVWVARPTDSPEICPEYFSSEEIGVVICSSGPEVATLQARLRAFGYELDVDGYFGERTQLALITFQASRNLSIDGRLTEETWALLARGE